MEKRYNCDVVVMEGCHVKTNINVTGNVYMAPRSSADGWDIDIDGDFYAEKAEFFNIISKGKAEINSSIGNDIRAEESVIMTGKCCIGDIYSNANVKVSEETTIWNISALEDIVIFLSDVKYAESLQTVWHDFRTDIEQISAQRVVHFADTEYERKYNEGA